MDTSFGSLEVWFVTGSQHLNAFIDGQTQLRDIKRQLR